MDNSICNNCNSINKHKILYKENKAQNLQIVKCLNCGLMYAFPLKIDKNQKYWEGANKIKINEKNRLFPDRMCHMVQQKERLQIADYLTSFKFIEKIVPNKGIALEVGASRGFFLHELEKKGWRVVGIEPSDTRRIEAKKLFGYDFIPDKLEDAKIVENSYDLIFLFHVIEHVLDPSGFIHLLTKYLKKEGILVMETPTYDSISYAILRHRERSLRCNGHFFFFTKKTLKQMVTKNGLKIIKHNKVGRTLSLERFLWNISVIIKNNNIEKFLFKICNMLKLEKVKFHINIGDMQRIYCQK